MHWFADEIITNYSGCTSFSNMLITLWCIMHRGTWDELLNIDTVYSHNTFPIRLVGVCKYPRLKRDCIFFALHQHILFFLEASRNVQNTKIHSMSLSASVPTEWDRLCCISMNNAGVAWECMSGKLCTLGSLLHVFPTPESFEEWVHFKDVYFPCIGWNDFMWRLEWGGCSWICLDSQHSL